MIKKIFVSTFLFIMLPCISIQSLFPKLYAQEHKSPSRVQSQILTESYSVESYTPAPIRSLQKKKSLQTSSLQKFEEQSNSKMEPVSQKKYRTTIHTQKNVSTTPDMPVATQPRSVVNVINTQNSLITAHKASSANVSQMSTEKSSSDAPYSEQAFVNSNFNMKQEKERDLIHALDVYTLSPHAEKLRFPSHTPTIISFYPQPHITKSDEEKINDLQATIFAAAHKYNLNPALITAIIKVESNFLTEALSSKGAQGLMQIIPQTQAYLELNDPHNPYANIMAGCAYFREQLDRFKSVELALAAYNAGPYTVIRYEGIPPFKETRAYVEKVLAYKKEFALFF